MKKCLILVMSSEKSPYQWMLTASEGTWASEKVENVETAFYCSEVEATPFEYHARGNTYLNFPIKETLFNVAEKTKLAFEWALKNCDFDYVLRANASTYVDKKVLLDYIQYKPTTYFAGLPAPTTLYPSLTHFMWGVQYIISRDLVELSVKREWDYSKMDDISISLSLHDQKFEKGRMLTLHHKENGCEYLEYNEGDGGGGFVKDLSELPQGHYAYRCKQDFDRSLDCKIMRELFKVKST